MTSPAHPTAAGPAGRPVLVPGPLDLVALEAEARQRMGEMAYAYFAGGAEHERLLAENVAAWAELRLHPRVLVDVSKVDTATTVLGTPVSSPVLIAPTAFQCLADPDGEVAMARGAAAAGTVMVLSSLSTTALEQVAAVGGPTWMQIYVLRQRARTVELVERAAAAGFSALVLTVDAPVSGVRLRELHGGVRLPDGLGLPNLDPASTERAREAGFMAVVTESFDPSITYDDIGWLAGLSGLPVVVKGVVRGDDARRCAEAGAAAVVVSNHGARQLDDAPPTAAVLAEVVDALDGQAEVYVDGGLRRAGDVAKALALGARAVMVGRPALWALGTGGHQGVRALVDWFGNELARTMALCGAPNVAQLDRTLVRRTTGGPL